VIDCGVDESERDGTLIVSAILAKTAMMQKLSQRWSADLRRMKVECFHATDHWNLNAKPYNGLSTGKRRELLDCLCGHVGNYVEFGVSVEVNQAEYKGITSDRFRSQFGSAYTMAIQILMIEIHRDLWQRKQTAEPVNILLERGPHIYQAMTLLKENNQGNPEAFVKINSVGEGVKCGNPILQAADLLAYGWGEYLKNKHSIMLSKIAAHRPKRFPIITWRKDMIEELVKGINEDIEHRRYFNGPPLRRGLKPLLKGPDYEAALAKRPVRS
jgi:hypothetical protein